MGDGHVGGAPDHYEVLGVERDADTEGIRAAYKRLLRNVHPDYGGNSALFRTVQSAWETLGNPELRRAYDQNLVGTRGSHALENARYEFPAEIAWTDFLRTGSLMDVDVILTPFTLGYLRSILGLIESSMSKRRAVMLLAADVDDEVVATFAVNSGRGVLPMAVSITPGFGGYKKGIVDDVAAVTGAGRLETSTYTPPSGVQDRFMVGRASTIDITRSMVTVTGGAGTTSRVETHLDSLRHLVGEVDKGAAYGFYLDDRISRIEHYLAQAAR